MCPDEAQRTPSRQPHAAGPPNLPLLGLGNDSWLPDTACSAIH